MLDNLVTPVVAIAIILGITLPIWLLVMLARLVYHVHRIADELESAHTSWLQHVQMPLERHVREVSNSMFAR